MVLEIISSVTSVISLANAGLGLYRSISGICRSDKSQARILDELKQIRIQFERLNDHIIYTPSLKAVIDLSQPSQHQVVDLREVKAYLEPVQQAIGQDIISSCMIPTPERLVRELKKNPYDVLDNIRPIHYAQSSSDPSLVPVLFQEGMAVYVGWIKRGLIPMVMGCEYDELWLSRPTIPPPVEAIYRRERLTSISTKVEPKTSMRKTSTSVSETRNFSAPNLNLDSLVNALSDWFSSQNFNVQALDVHGGGRLIQASKGGWRNLVGMASALNVVLRKEGTNLSVEIGAGKWMDKAGVGTVGLFVLWPLALAAGWVAWQQSQLPGRTFDFIQRVCRELCHY